MSTVYIRLDWRDMLHIIHYFICYTYLSTITLNYCLIFTTYINIDTFSIYIYMENIIIPIIYDKKN